MIIKPPKTISETHEGLINGEFSCVDLVDTYIERIDKYNGDLNALLTISEEVAYQKAKINDEIIKTKGRLAFNEHPLLGVTVVHKDIFLTKGIRTTAASKVLTNYTPQYSSAVVDKLNEAGAIILGKANCDAWAHGASGENSDFGPTKNPWNKSFVPGGSSSGSAVSVAADLSLISTGTDTGGSIRQPAGFCNVVGFKPTYGTVSRYGVIAMASSLDSVGHFTRTVVDTEKVLKITKGTDGKDGTLADYELSSSNKKIKIGIPKEYFIEGLNKEVKEKLEEVINILKKEKIEFVEISLPHTKYAISVYYIVQPAEVSSNLGRFDGIRYGEKRSEFGIEAKRRIMLGTYVLSSGYYDAYYLKAMKVRSKIVADFDSAFSTVDAIIAPVSPTPPFKIGEKSSDPLQMYLADIFTVAANLSGIPGLSIPAGFSSTGLPIGFQLLGNRFSEQTLFDIGKLYQSKTNYHLKSPNL